ncbi:aspartate aminotransferase, partial [candidate division KSB1 bacterium]
LFNNPTNPSGVFYDENELLDIANFCVENNIIIITDEIYEKLVYDGKQYISIASLSKDIYENTITINGVSKSYAMTGWRIGYAAGPKDIIKAMGNLQGHITSNPSSISQYASVEALNTGDDSINKMVKEFEKRRNFVYENLSEIDEIEVFKPEGAFYIFPRIKNFFNRIYKGKKIKNSTDLCEYLLTEAKVAVVPGIAFGNDEHIRISYANSMENLEKAMIRLKKYFQKLQ